MRRVRLYKPPVGVALFEVGRDRTVAMIDLMVSGLKAVARSWGVERYSKQFEVIDSTIEALGVNLSRMRAERLLLKHKGRTVLCCLYWDGATPMVRYAAIATFSPGTLIKVVRRLESSGWKRRILIELKSRRVAHA